MVVSCIRVPQLSTIVCENDVLTVFKWSVGQEDHPAANLSLGVYRYL